MSKKISNPSPERLREEKKFIMSSGRNMIDLLRDMLCYIEEKEWILDAEYGEDREFIDIVNDGDAPQIYHDIKNKISKLEEV